MINIRIKKQKTKPPIIELDKVSFRYDKAEVLSSISFKIKEGEKIVFVGANGSGKSTLLKILDCLVFPTEGIFSAFGNIVDQAFLGKEKNEYDFRRKVGYIFQDSDVQLFCATVWDEVIFAPLHMGLGKNEVIARGEEALRIMGILHLKDRTPYQLSGGEKKKVALASVLSYSPKVWLFDEPTLGLDPRSQSRLLDFIYQIGKKNNTIITATNDLSIIKEIADRMIVLSENHTLVADDSPEKILNDSQFLNKHNLIHEHLHRHKKKEHKHVHKHYYS